MRVWVVLAPLYVLIAALIVPGPLGAQEDPAQPEGTGVETVPAELAPVPAEPAPAPPEPVPAPAEQAAAPAEPAPAPAPQAEAPPAEPAPAPAVPAEPKPAAREPLLSSPEPARGDSERRGRRKATAVAAATQNVTIVDYEFTPARITVQQGDTITWTNEGPTPHSATAPDGGFDTGIFSEGGSRSETFDEAGTFAYICTPHPNMKGTVVVEASTSGEGGSGSGEGEAGGESGSTGAVDDSSSGESESTGSSSSSSASSSSPRSGSGLPATGADVLTLVLLGLAMLALGLALQRRAREPRSGGAGRGG